ncbi:MAG: flavodoxin family protein [Candidatus Bathyarchaeia archaeon]
MGIVGSPRKGRLTDQLVTRVLDGAKDAGMEAKKVYLIDFDIKYYTEEKMSCPRELSKLCEEADAIVLGAPVYWGDINGLTKDFMDTVEISNANGKWALGIAVAGGTGKGLCSGIQSIYHFFYHREMRGIDPTPVSRFNFKEALWNLYYSGKKLVALSEEKKPFRSLQERIEYYEGLDYMNDTPLDEILLLTRQLIKISKGEKRIKSGEEYAKAELLKDQGKRVEAVVHAVKAYEMLYFEE